MQPKDPQSPQIDIHCHSLTLAEHWQILSLDSHQLIDSDTAALLERIITINPASSQRAPCNRFVSIGVHPWFIAKQEWHTSLQTLTSVCRNPRVLAIGECGLDKCVDTPMALQIEVFSRQIALAEELGKPLIIHCVKAFNEIMQLKKSLAPIQPWIIHGFTGKPALAEQLLRQGCYLSFGKALLRADGYVGRTLVDMPIDRIFLETDAAEDVSIGAIYAAAAKITALDVSTLQRQIVANFHRVFIHD